MTKPVKTYDFSYLKKSDQQLKNHKKIELNITTEQQWPHFDIILIYVRCQRGLRGLMEGLKQTSYASGAPNKRVKTNVVLIV